MLIKNRSIWITIVSVTLILSGYPFFGSAFGETVVEGAINKDTTWKLAGSPYIVKEDLWVRSPATLTLESGVRVQFDNGTGLIVWDGSLKAEGTSDQPITFTSLSGRTNGWTGILFNASETSDLTFCIIEKAGEERDGIHANVRCQTNSLILDNCTIRECGGHGLYLGGTSPRIENCQISIGKGSFYGLFGENKNSNPTLIGNTFEGEGDNVLRVGPLSKLESNRFESDVTKGIEIIGGTISQDRQWTKQIGQSTYTLVKEDLWIRSPATLMIESGVRVQFDNGTGLIVWDGSLKAEGTSNQPITFTSLSGKTNGWTGILFNASQPSNLTFCIIEKAGEERDGIHANVRCQTNSLVLDNCTIREGGGHGLYIQNGNPRVENCQISGNNTSEIIYLVSASPSLTGNTVTGEASAYWLFSENANSNPTLIGNTFEGEGDNVLRVGPLSKLESNRFESDVTKGIEIIGGTISQDRQWTRQIGQSTYTLVKEDLWVRSPATLMIESGVRVQFDNGTGLIVWDGSLKAEGTSNQPITFTSLSGKTNGWKGILFNASQPSNLTYCIIEKAGEERDGIHANVRCQTNSLVLDNCTIQEGGGHGLYIRAKPIINARNRFLGFPGGQKFALYNDSRNDIDATNNYWGTVNSTSIAAQIFDKEDDSSKGTVNFTSFLSAADFIPAVPALLAPTDGAEVNTVTPLLQWEPASESLSYVLQIAKDKNFDQILIAEPMLLQPNYLVPDAQLVSNQTYYWRVKAENYIDSSGWSEVNSFRVRIAADGETVPAIRTYTMTLEAGINLASVPVQPETEWKLSNLAEFIGLDAVSFIVWYDKAMNKFRTYMPSFPADSPANIPVQGGEGYIIVMLKTKTVSFTGLAWGNELASPPHLIARSNSTRTPLFAISGMVFGEDGTPLDNVQVAIKNLNTGRQVLTTTGVLGRSGQCVATFSDLTGNRAAQIGDRLEVSIVDKTGGFRSEPIQVSIPNEAIRSSRLDLPPLTVFPVPKASALLQNYPNPFNPETWIPYQLAQDTEVIIQIYDIKGELICSFDLGQKLAGFYVSKERAAYWDGRNDCGEKVASGVYFYTIRTKDFTATRRLFISK